MGHQPWEYSMNISFSTPYIAAVQGEISPMKTKSVYIFSIDKSF